MIDDGLAILANFLAAIAAQDFNRKARQGRKEVPGLLATRATLADGLAHGKSGMNELRE